MSWDLGRGSNELARGSNDLGRGMLKYKLYYTLFFYKNQVYKNLSLDFFKNLRTN